jgi:hypothetical protein
MHPQMGDKFTKKAGLVRPEGVFWLLTNLHLGGCRNSILVLLFISSEGQSPAELSRASVYFIHHRMLKRKERYYAQP